jgi:hypothetical protein
VISIFELNFFLSKFRGFRTKKTKAKIEIKKNSRDDGLFIFFVFVSTIKDRNKRVTE